MDIETERDYDEALVRIEKYLKKATNGGGFHVLTSEEADELEKLSLSVQEYEEKYL